MARSRHRRPRKGGSHVYTGPTTRYGLIAGADCRLVGGKSGGSLIRTLDGRQWLVGRDQVKRAG